VIEFPNRKSVASTGVDDIGAVKKGAKAKEHAPV